MTPIGITQEIVQLFDHYGAAGYDGEPVSQLAHMLQCALIAEESTGDADLVVGALLHDIGHLLKHTLATEAMGMYGVVNHESIGAAYLRDKGFGARVCAVVEGHVAAKRYLVATDPGYRGKLSEASVQTLAWQGGPMSEAEAKVFEQHPHFTDILQVRRWDELSKDPYLQLPPLSYFEPVILQHLLRQQYLYANTH